MEQIDLTAQPFDRTAALEQENARLRAELAACRNPRSRTTRDPAIAAAPEYLQCAGSDCTSSAAEHRLLEATATAANALLTITPFDEAVNAALQMIGEALDTDRIDVHENFDHCIDKSFKYWRALYDWSSLHTIPQLDHPEAGQGSYEPIHEWYLRMEQGQSISYLIEESPEPFRTGQIAIGVKATHIVPISVEDQFWGILGIDDCREAKRRSSSELAVLKIAADCIGSAIQRDRTQQALLQAEQARSAELERYNTELQQANEEILEREREKALLLRSLTKIT